MTHFWGRSKSVLSLSLSFSLYLSLSQSTVVNAAPTDVLLRSNPSRNPRPRSDHLQVELVPLNRYTGKRRLSRIDERRRSMPAEQLTEQFAYIQRELMDKGENLFCS